MTRARTVSFTSGRSGRSRSRGSPCRAKLMPSIASPRAVVWRERLASRWDSPSCDLRNSAWALSFASWTLSFACSALQPNQPAAMASTSAASKPTTAARRRPRSAAATLRACSISRCFSASIRRCSSARRASSWAIEASMKGRMSSIIACGRDNSSRASSRGRPGASRRESLSASSSAQACIASLMRSTVRRNSRSASTHPR